MADGVEDEDDVVRKPPVVLKELVQDTATRGKGRVRPRKAQMKKYENLTVQRIDIVSHADRELGEKEGDPAPRYPEALTDGTAAQVPRVRWNGSPSDAAKLHEALRTAQPVVIRGAPFLGDFSSKYKGDHRPGVLGKWTFDYLANAMGTHVKDWPCLVSSREKDRFMPYDETKNIFASMYHVREPETERFPCSCAEFVKCTREWTERTIHLDATVASFARAEGAPLPGPDDATTAPEPSKKIGRGVAGDLRDELDWKFLGELLKEERFGPVHSVMLSAGMRNSLRPFFYTAYESFHAQATGRRRVTLVDPAQSFKGMYPFPCAHTYDRQSMVDFDKPDYGQWPLLSKVRGLVTILEPGDMLFVPAYWWRHEQQLEKENVALEMPLYSAKRVRRPEAVGLITARLIEDRVNAAETLQHAKRWLRIIAENEEADWIDLGTVQGHRRIRMVQMVRDEVDLNLGRGKWQEFLRDLIDGRLDPTPWLNVNFREPLYLKDKPVHHPDTRTALELQFPELYVNKLRLEGYDVKGTPMSVLNPNHPEFIGKNDAATQEALAGQNRQG